MKGILLAFISFCFLVLASVVAVRFYRGKKYFRPLIAVFILSAFFYTLLFFYLPDDLRVNRNLDFANGLFILFLLFHSYWDTIYTSFFTGFSSKILIQFFRKGTHGFNAKELIQMYQKDLPGNPVIDCRLDNLIRESYLTSTGEGQYLLLPKGNFFASLTQVFQKVLHMGEGG